MTNANRELQVPGARLRYRDEGAGCPVVFVHGWTLDLDVWAPQAPLTARLRVVRYDRRGFGRSSGRPSLVQDVADLHALLAALGIASPLLVGMSQGARVVLEFADRHPHLAGGLVLDGAPPCAGSTDLDLQALRRIAGRDGLEAFRRVWSAHPLTRLVTDDPDTRALLARILARYPGHDLLSQAAPAGESIDAGLLARIRAPVLIVNGALDSDTRRRAGQRLCDALGCAERVIIDGAAHLPNLDAPRAYNRLMSGFARRHLSAAA